MAGLFGTAWNGISSFFASFSQKSLIPRKENNFDNDNVRLSRYQIFAAYVDNEVYSSTFLQSAGLKIRNQLYTNIRAIMNMTGRVVDLFVYYVYLGNIDLEHLTSGAIPIATDDETVREAIKQVFISSDWNANKEIYVRTGATYGDSAIKIVDDRKAQQVRMEVLDPGRVIDKEVDANGDVQSVIIEYERDEELDLTNISDTGFVGRISSVLRRKCYTYTEIITATRTIDGVEVPGKFRTFKDGKPYAFYTDMNGKPVSEWDNEYPFVPVVFVQHTKTGLKWGANAFYKVLHKIDEINDIASLLNDQIRKIVIPILVAVGIKKKPGEDGMEFSADNRDALNIAHIPKDTDLKPLVTALDIASVNGNMAVLNKEIENDLPILALQQIRSGSGDLSQPGVEAAYTDAIGAVNSARANYDPGLVKAIKMAITIAGYNGYKGFESFGIDSMTNGDLEFSIKNRPVINISLSTEQRVTLLSSVASMPPALQEVALKEMGFSDDVIEAVKQGALEAQANAVKGMMQGLMGNKLNGGSTAKGAPKVGAGQQQKMIPAKVGG